ncbi:unnamed protein product [Rhodiola kirilowii]
MQKQFVSKYYPAGRAAQVWKQLQELKQGPNETMYEYVEKFLALEKTSAGGNLMNLMPARVKQKIISVAESERFQDESTKEDEYARTKNVSKVEPSISAMAAEMKEMRELMQHVIRRQPVQVKPCEFCAATDHKTDECPTLVADNQADVNAVGNYQSYGNQPGPVRQHDAAAPNQGANGQLWRNNNQQHQPARQNVPQQPYQHPHHQFRQNTPGQYQQNAPNQYQQRGQNSNQPGPSNQGSSNKALEDMIKDLASAVIQDRATTKGDIEDLKKQMSQLTTTVSDLAASLNTGRLPSQTIPNPKGNVSAVTLRSGRNAAGPAEPEDETAEPSTSPQDEPGPDLIPSVEASQLVQVPIIENSNVQVPLPFPVQVRAPKKYVMDKEVWELFSKVEINIPLLEAISRSRGTLSF